MQLVDTSAQDLVRTLQLRSPVSTERAELKRLQEKEGEGVDRKETQQHKAEGGWGKG